MTPTRIAIAGAGSAGSTHARAVEQIEGATVVAGACRTEARGRDFATKFDCTWYDDIESMLDAETPDVLSVCTPSGAHLQPTLAAAERGIDVLCEKPLELTTDRIDRMGAAAAENGIRLGGIFQRRYLPALQTVHSAVAGGRFGDLAVATAYVPWWRPDEYYEDAWQSREALDGGATMNQAIHAVDAVQWLAGAGMDLTPDENPVEELFAYSDIRGHDDIDVEDTTVATLRFRDGTLGQILSATSLYPGSALTVQLGGHAGTAEVREGALTSWQFRDSEPGDQEIRSAFDKDGAGGDAPEPLETANIRAFLDARRAEMPFELCHTEARKAVEIVEAIYQSAATNAPVSL